MERILRKGISEEDDDEIESSTTLTDYLQVREPLKEYITPQFDVKTYLSTQPELTPESYISETRNTLKDYLMTEPEPPLSLINNISSVVQRTDISTRKKLRIIQDSVKRETRKVVSQTTFYQSITNWISSNWKQIAWNTAWYTAISIAVGVAYISFTAGSWFLLLELLKRIGLKMVPQALFSALAKAGISIGTNVSIDGLISLAKKNDKIRGVLQKEVSTEFLSSIGKKLGIDIDEKIKAEDILRFGINTGVNLGVTNLQGYLISSGINLGVTKVKESLKTVKHKAEAVVSNLSSVSVKVKTETAKNILNNEPETITETVVNTIETQTRIPKVESASNRVRNITEIDKPVEQAVGYNKLLTAATITSIAMVGIALSGKTEDIQEIMQEQLLPYGNQALEKLGTLGLGTFNYVKESRYIKVMLTQYLLEKVGVNQIIDTFSDYLTPKDEAKLKSIKELIAKEKSKSKIAKLSDQFLTILTGGNYYDISSLQTFQIAELRGIYRNINPKDIKYSTYTKDQLVALILDEQRKRRVIVTNVLNSAMKTTLKGATATIVYELSVEGYAYAKSSLEEVQEELERSFDVDREEMEKEARETKISQKEKIEEMKARFKEEQEQLKAEKMVEEAKALKEIKKKEIEDLKAQFKEEREILKEIHLEEQKQAEIEAETRYQRALGRLKSRLEEKNFQEALRLEEITKKLGVIITTEEGVSHPIPPDEVLLNKDLQKALDIKITPLFEYLTKEAAKASTSWIPGIGWIQAGIQKINIGLTTAETIKDVGKIAEVIARIDRGETDIEPTLGKLDELLKLRLPSLNSIVDEAVKTSQINLKEMLLRKLKDKFIEGWDNQRVAYEIGKELIGPGEDFGVDIIQSIGEKIWSKLEKT